MIHLLIPLSAILLITGILLLLDLKRFGSSRLQQPSRRR